MESALVSSKIRRSPGLQLTSAECSPCLVETVTFREKVIIFTFYMRTTATKAATTFRSISTERLREIKERADYLALKNAALRGELLERDAILRAGEAFVISVRSLIETSSMTKEEKNSLLETLSTWPITVSDAAKKQARQIHIKRGAEEKED